MFSYFIAFESVTVFYIGASCFDELVAQLNCSSRCDSDDMVRKECLPFLRFNKSQFDYKLQSSAAVSCDRVKARTDIYERCFPPFNQLPVGVVNEC